MSSLASTKTGSLIDRPRQGRARASYLHRWDRGGEIDALIGDVGIDTITFDQAQARTAREAFRRFGKGRHRAGLNLGDCFAYALAKTLGAPLLFKGDDFALTDIKRAL